MLKIRSLLSVRLVLLILLSSRSFAQKGYIWEYGVMTGVSNYLGEIGGRQNAARPFLTDIKLAKTRWSETVYLRYGFHPKFAAKLAFNYLRIEGDDHLTSNPARHYRNLNFRNDIFDLESTISWFFYRSDKPTGIFRKVKTYFNAYAFAGIGGYYHNPKTLYQGSYIALQPLQTEGVKYSKFGYCVPFGAGFYVAIVKRRRSHRIGMEFNWRYTGTDYLDDISTDYKNPAELNSLAAVALSNRNKELSNQPAGFDGNYGWHGVDKNGNPVNQAPRGNPSNKDSYLSISVSYGVSLKSFYTKSRSRSRKIRSVSF
jgi:hypothetical protein